MVSRDVLVGRIASQGRRLDSSEESDYCAAARRIGNEFGRQFCVGDHHSCRRVRPKLSQGFVHQLVNAFEAAIVVEPVGGAVGGEYVTTLGRLALCNVWLDLRRNREEPVAYGITAVLDLMGVANDRDELPF